MAFRSGDYFLVGELNNVQNYTTWGYLQLLGLDTPVYVHLTGNFSEDLRGKKIRFEAATMPSVDPEGIKGFARQQIGVTGAMTADGWCKTFDCTPEEYYQRLKLGEPPTTRWERRLYLEWFSQNGRVVLELADPIIEFQDEEEWKTLPPSTPKPDEDSEDGCPDEQKMIGFEATMITSDGEVRSIVRKAPEAEEEVDDLQDELDAESEEIDELIQGDGDVEDFMAETELMDDLIEQEQGERIADFLDEPMDYLDPDRLTDEEAESALKTLLAQMALYNIALNMCEHFTPREAYRLLVTDILLEDGAFPQLRGTGWVTHHSTAEYCKICEEEFDREYDEKMKSEGIESQTPDSDFSTEINDMDDLPF